MVVLVLRMTVELFAYSHHHSHSQLKENEILLDAVWVITS